MAVIIKRKAAPVTPQPVLAQGDSDLDDVGLAPEQTVLGHIVNHPRLWKKGTRVVCLDPGIGSWYPYWQPGDTGVVQRGFLAAGAHENQPDSDVYHLLMDKPRDQKHPETYIHCRQLRVLDGKMVEAPKQRPVPDRPPVTSTPLPTVVKEAPRPVLASSVPVRQMGISKTKRSYTP